MTCCSLVAVLALVGMTKKRFGYLETLMPQITTYGMSSML